MRKNVVCMLAVLICFSSLPVVVASASDEITDEYMYYGVLYYDATNPYNNVYGNTAYAYECYVNQSFSGKAKPIIFVHNGSIVRNDAVNQNLSKIYVTRFAEQFDLNYYINAANNYIDISKDLKFAGIIKDIGSAASQSLGKIGSIYFTGGTASVSQIATMVAAQTVEELTGHLCDVTQIIADAQLTYFYLTTAELQSLVTEIEDITDFNSFANCEKYAESFGKLVMAKRCADILMQSIVEDLEDSDTFLEVLGQFTKDIASGFVGGFAEFLASYDEIVAMQKADPEYLSRIIKFASDLADCEETVGDFGNLLVSVVEFGFGDHFTVVEAYEARENAPTPMRMMASLNKFGLMDYPSTETETETETETDNDAGSSTAVKMTLAELQEKFPHGKYWNHTVGGKNNPDGYTSTPCRHHTGKVPCSHTICQGDGGCCYYGQCGCNSYANAVQCMGFAYKLGYDAFGSNPRNWTKVYNLNSLKAGDIIRYNYHSIFVTAVNGDTITFADCNYKGTCQIRWNQTITKSNIKNLDHVRSAPATFDSASSASHIATDFNATVKDGIYTLKIAHSSGTMLNVYNGSVSCVDGTKLTTWAKDGTADQKFYFKHESGGKYRIYAVCSGTNGSVYKKAVDVNVGSNGTVEVGDTFDVWTKSDSWNHCQLFYVVPVEDGKYVIELASTPRAVLAAQNATEAAQNGGAITLREYKSYTTQQWYFYNETGTTQVDPSIDASAGTSKYYTGTYKVSVAEGLNIRSGAGTSYKKLDALKNNTTVTVVEINSNWGKITYDGVTGWICLDYTTYVSPLIDSVSVETTPSKMSYFVGDTLDTTGLTLKITYSNATSKTVSEGFTCTPSVFVSLGKQTVLVDYNGSYAYFDVDVTTKNYAVNYDANGGNNAPFAQTKVQGEDLTLSSVIPDREGYVFKGWATSCDATDASYEAGGTYNYDADVTLYAVWEKEVVAPVATIKGATVSLGQALSITYNAIVQNATTTPVMKYTIGGKDVIEVEGEYNATTGRYYFKLSGIGPQAMGDNILAEVYVGDVLAGSKDEYSIKANLVGQLGKEATTDVLKTLIYNTLAYGAAAQVYIGYNTNNLANAGYEDKAVSYTMGATDGSDQGFSLNNTRTDIKISAMSVNFSDVNKIMIQYVGSDALYVNGVAVEPASYDAATGKYLYYTDGIYASALGQVFTFTLKVDGEVVSTLTCSINAYSARQQGKNTNNAKLAEAMFNYGMAAKAYMG